VPAPNSRAIDGFILFAHYDTAQTDAEALVAKAVLIEAARFPLEKTTRAAGQLLDARARPTAIACDDDLLAVGVYKAARQRRLRAGGLD
jgi:DNA-binding LacI/PurR family transcriptional regulator